MLQESCDGGNGYKAMPSDGLVLFFVFLSPHDALWEIPFWIRIWWLWVCLQQPGSGENKKNPSKLTRNIQGTVYAKPNTGIFIGSIFPN